MTPEAAAAVLGVSLDADRASIEAAFRRTAKRTHPDRFAGDGSARLRAAAADFDRATRARETLLGMARPMRAETPAARPTPPPAARARPPVSLRSVSNRERAVLGTAVGALLLVVGAVLAVGLLPDGAVTTGPASSFSDPTSDLLHGLNVIQITDVQTVERQCDGRSACWLWSVESARSCAHGILTIDFFGSANPTVPTETISQDVTLAAHSPSFVTASRAGFPEPRAHISRFSCNS